MNATDIPMVHSQGRDASRVYLTEEGCVQELDLSKMEISLHMEISATGGPQIYRCLVWENSEYKLGMTVYAAIMNIIYEGLQTVGHLSCLYLDFFNQLSTDQVSE